MRRIHALALVAAAFAAVPATAAAQEPSAEPDEATEKQELSIELERINGRHETVVDGDRIVVRGTLTRYVWGQDVVVRFYRGGRKVRAKRVTVQPGEDGTGTFVLGHRARRPGHVVVRATHRATEELETLRAEGKGFDVLPRRVRRGDRGRDVRMLQRALDDRGYVVGRRGRFDARTRRAVLAFRKVTGMARTTSASSAVMRRLARGGGRFRVKFPSHGRHVEADISRQVVALIGKGGKVERIYHTSTGAPSTPTIRGTFRVYRKDPGTNAIGMVHSAYFIRGYAIHGYKSVPTYNASHGCLRVPIPDARSIYNWIRMGTIVDTYR